MKNPYNQQSVEYKLSIPPAKVMQLVSTFAEERGLHNLLDSSQRRYTEFWYKFNGDEIFIITRKAVARGYSNSFAPWLFGWVTPDKGGAKVKIFFDVDETVSTLSKIIFYQLIFFTVVISWFFISGIMSGNLTTEHWIGLTFILAFWVFNLGLRKLGFYLGQRDKPVLIDFVERIFSSYKTE